MKSNLFETMGRLVASLVLVAVLAGCGGDRLTVSPPRAATLTVISGNNQSGTVAQALPSPVVVKVADESGKPFVGATVTWTITSGGGIVDHASSVTGSDGTASALWTVGTQAGSNSLTAATGSLPPVSFVATGTPGPFARVTISPPSTPVETGDLMQLVAVTTDAYGNAVQISMLMWTSSDAGIAKVTADGFLVALAPGTVSISAGSGQVVGSLPLTINPGITFSFGPEETVFTWLTDRCEDLDVPDVAAHVVRLADGTLMLLSGDAPRYYTSFGPDFSSFQRSCAPPALVSGDDYYPESYDNQEWINSIYCKGDVIYALMSNEYHDPFAPNCSPGNTHPGNPCWYNSNTYAYSTDGGHTFTHPTPPSHVVDPAPVVWDPQGTPTTGYFFPSNIVTGQDGFYYSLFMSSSDWAGTCVMRTQTLDDPASWRAWDGTGYNLQLTSPYTDPATVACTAVGVGQTLGLAGSLTYNTYLGKYMLVGTVVVGGPTEYVCGDGYSLSPDLIHWTPRRLLRPASWAFSSFPCWPYETTPKTYPSIIDHNDATVNFERPGQTPYLYFTRFNNSYLDRDLVRVPMTITSH